MATPSHEIRIVVGGEGQPREILGIRVRSYRGESIRPVEMRAGDKQVSTRPTWLDEHSAPLGTHRGVELRYVARADDASRDRKRPEAAPLSSLTNGVSAADEYPAYDPEVDPYPPAVYSSIVDAAVTSWTSNFNAVTALVEDAELWEYVPPPALHSSTSTVLGARFLSFQSGEPCARERSRMRNAHGLYAAGLVASIATVIGLGFFPPAAIVAAGVLGSEAVGMAGLHLNLEEKKEDFEECVADHSSYYRRS